MKKKGWNIVSLIIRELGEHCNLLDDAQTDTFHIDIADIMDCMQGGRSFKNAIKILREEEDDRFHWLEEFLERLEIEL